MGFTTTDAANVLNAQRGTAYGAWTPFLAFFTASPTDAGTTTAELSGGGYARQSVTFGVPSNKVSANTNALTFSATPGTVITHIALMDAASAGTMRRWIALGSSVTVGTSGQVTVAVGAITDTLA